MTIIRGTNSANVLEPDFFDLSREFTIYGLGGNDTITGGESGTNTIYAGAGHDTIYITLGNNDLLYGQAGNDVIDASVAIGGVIADGGAGNDNLIGSMGADTLKGGAGRDTIDGGIGNDRITGGRGADRLSGGIDDDTFVFTSIADIGLAKGFRDIITDFGSGLYDDADIIDLSAIDANTKANGNNAFKFLAKEGTAFHSKAGELRWDQTMLKGSKVTYVEGDVNGDGKADFRLELTGHISLDSSDFVL